MVVDTSALIAIIYREAGHERLEQAIGQDSTRLISAASALEASIVMARRAGPARAQQALTILDAILLSLGLSVEPVTTAQVKLARDAYFRFGKGMSGGGLNYGDCFSYALATDSSEPLLFVGDDFARTDVATVP